MEVEASTLSSRKCLSSTLLPRPGPVHEKDVPKKGDRKDKVHQVSESTLYSPEEGLCRQEDHLRSLTPEHVHLQEDLQDADFESGEAPSAQGSLDCLPRLEGRLLSSEHCEDLQTLHGFPIQRPKLALQGNAFRPLHCPSDLYQAHQFRCPPIRKGRHMVSSLFGRPPDNSFLERGMSSETQESCRDHREPRLADKLGKVQNRTQSNLRMAGSPIQFGRTHPIKLSHNLPTIQSSTEGVIGRRLLHQEEYNEDSGFSQLAGPNRPSHKSLPFSDKDYSETSPKSPSRCQATDGLQNQDTACEMAVSPQFYPSPGATSSFDHSPDGRLSVGVWVQNKPPTVPGQISQLHEKILDKCSGTSGDLVGHSHDPGKESSGQDSNRQFDSDFCHKEIYINNLPSGRVDGTNLEESDPPELDLNPCPHKGDVQCNCRSIIPRHSHINRVVDTSSHFQADHSQLGTQTTGRPVCNQSKPSIRDLRIPLSRSSSSCSGRTDDQLGQVELPLSLPPSPNDFEGFSEVDSIKFRKGNSHNKRGNNETVVFTSQVSSYAVIHNRGKTAAARRRSTNKRNKDFQTSRLGVLKVACAEQFPDCDQQTINLIASSVKKTSEADYQRKWEFFLQFIKEKGVAFEDIKPDIVLRFFSFLFYTKGLKPSTVCHYRSALARPLLEYFNINLRRPQVNSMLRAMKLQRPNDPSPRPAWKLSKVLAYLQSLDTSSQTNSLRKTAFLLLLATGWRISEIHACVRNVEFTRFTESHNVLLQPHASFLAKNGLRKRMEAKEIKALKLQDGQSSSICPVEALKEYLLLTSGKKEGPLFLSPKDGSNLSIFQLRYQICSLITEADPATKAKVHDIRKYAASCSLQQDMLVGDLTEDFNWSTPAIFYKFYFLQTDILDMPVSLPVRS